MKLEIGKQYKNRAGGRAIVLDYDDKADGYLVWYKLDETIRYHNADGSLCGTDGTPSPYDLVSDWVEPRTGWGNIFAPPAPRIDAQTYKTREEADEHASRYTDRIACVQWTEGQGLEEDGE